MRSLIANPFKGKTRSLETRLKISLAKRGKSNSMKGRKMPRHAKFGESNPRWKGGVSKLSRRIRRLAEYKEWRSKVFQKCSRRGTYLHAHHIKPLYQILAENQITTVEQALLCPNLWLVSNGQTLCIECHAINGRPKLVACGLAAGKV
jgi:ribosomal protein L32